MLGRKWQKRGWISPILQGLDFPDFAGLDFPDFLPRCVNGAWKEVESKDSAGTAATPGAEQERKQGWTREKEPQF